MVVRKLLDLIFSQHDLAWLDDILPDKDKKKKEDDKKKKKEKKAAEPESDEEVREMWTNRAFFSSFFYVRHSICYGFVIPGIVFLTNTVCFSSLSHSVAEKALYNTYYCLFVCHSSLWYMSTSPNVFQKQLFTHLAYLCSLCPRKPSNV